jgi:hypothetical protein
MSGCSFARSLDRAPLHRPFIGVYERLQAREAELAYNAAKGRILKKLAVIKIVKNRSALCEIENGKPQKGSPRAQLGSARIMMFRNWTLPV